MNYERPIEVTDLDMAFPAQVIGRYIPERAELPEEYRTNWHDNKFCRIASRLFYKGGAIGTVKKNIDGRMAARHLKTVLGSFEPSHEHKIGAAGWLLSMWLEEAQDSD